MKKMVSHKSGKKQMISCWLGFLKIHFKHLIFTQDGDIFSLNSKPLKFVKRLIYLRNNISSNESDINICIKKLWSAMNKLSNTWKCDLLDKIKQGFFRAVHPSAIPRLLWTGSGNNILYNSNWMTTYLPSHKAIWERGAQNCWHYFRSKD